MEDRLQRYIKIAIIEEVPANTPTKRCHKMGVTSRPGSTKPRRTVDMSALKSASNRRTHPGVTLPQGPECFSQLSYKTVTDA